MVSWLFLSLSAPVVPRFGSRMLLIWIVSTQAHKRARIRNTQHKIKFIIHAAYPYRISSNTNNEQATQCQVRTQDTRHKQTLALGNLTPAPAPCGRVAVRVISLRVAGCEPSSQSASSQQQQPAASSQQQRRITIWNEPRSPHPGPKCPVAKCPPFSRGG